MNDFTKFSVFVKGTLITAEVIKNSGKVLRHDMRMHFNRILNDCSNFEKYASVIVPASTSYDEFKTKSSNWQSTTYAQKAGIATTDSDPYPLEDIHKSNSLVNVTPLNTAAAGTTGFNSYEGRRYVLFGTDSEETYLNVSLPFSAFKFTALALDKMVYSPANLIFQFYFSPHVS